MTERRSLPWTWVVIGTGEDGNWWVEEFSDGSLGTVESLSVMDPEQVRHVTQSLETYRDQGYRRAHFVAAFHPWRVESSLSDGRLRLAPAEGSFFDEGVELFAVPDFPLDLEEDMEQTGNYPGFLEQLEHMRIHHLNRTHHYAKDVDELEMEDELRSMDTDRYFTGEVAHVYEEIREILDWAPAEWEDETDAGQRPS